ANVVLIGPGGRRLWESGYTDRWGDVADIHSADVRQKRIPFDHQLFNLQTMFLITGAKGTDREFFLPVNVDIDQLPYLRPGAQPISVINHPPFIRMEGRSLPPLGSRKVPYKVPAHLLCKPGRYRLSFRLRSRAEPIYFMRFCDSTREMQRAMNEWMVDFHQSSVEFEVR
ncbi:MAG: cytochrome C, partial [Pirellulales bacterium]|nr:cytochrome C [Pirellulales bacterium]